MVTFDGLRYDIHVHGELIFAKSTDTSSSFKQIQARTEPVHAHPSKPAVTTGIVIEDSSAPLVQISMAREPAEGDDPSACVNEINQCDIELYVTEPGQVHEKRELIHGTGSDKVKLDVNRNRITIQYPFSDNQLKVVADVQRWRNACHFSVSYIFGTCATDVIGPLGSPDGEWRNDWMDTSGTPITIPSTLRRGSGFEPTYNYIRDNWCIPTEDDSLFVYEDSTSFDFFDKCDNP